VATATTSSTTPGTTGDTTWTGTLDSVRTSTATTEPSTFLIQLLGDTPMDGLGITTEPAIGTTVIILGGLPTTDAKETSVTLTTNGDGSENNTSTTTKTRPSTATKATSMSTTHPSGDTRTTGTGTAVATATTTSTTPGTPGDTTWTGTLPTVRTSTATTEPSTFLTQLLGDTIQDGLGISTEAADSNKLKTRSVFELANKSTYSKISLCEGNMYSA